ncbi:MULTISPECIES: DUF3237 family protein [unclassified Sphingobium]|uniref:DUF3237 family protein n=1 Tax=unclassified Sphingobium TaxID=2611147 RepID=UPI0022250043|nr:MULTISPECIES: DUF3237 family protein [unclassified Sphingobium]MCW2395924.1 hypothetical protein [Sphingobium sp. B8D3B]MCW2419440.1 hypothetical protein [Sphingobium sp. B8D3C]
MSNESFSRRSLLSAGIGAAGVATAFPAMAAAQTSAAAARQQQISDMTGKALTPPSFEFAFEIKIELGKRLRYGPTFWGMDRGYVGVLGGTVKGPKLNGKIIPHSGGDWPTVKPDNTVRFDARYLIEADDGTIIELHNTGVRYGSKEVLERMRKYEPVDPSEYYMGLTPRFDAPVGPHDWLSRTIFVGKADRRESQSIFTYWAMV